LPLVLAQQTPFPTPTRVLIYWCLVFAYIYVIEIISFKLLLKLIEF